MILPAPVSLVGPAPGGTVPLRSPLVRVQVVADVRGISTEHALELGYTHFQWVWNVGSGSLKRDLRFWSQELINPDATKNLTLDKVLDIIVPWPEKPLGFNNREVTDILRIQRKTMLEIRLQLDAGINRAGEILVPRAGVQKFLRERWLFAGLK